MDWWGLTVQSDDSRSTPTPSLIGLIIFVNILVAWTISLLCNRYCSSNADEKEEHLSENEFEFDDSNEELDEALDHEELVKLRKRLGEGIAVRAFWVNDKTNELGIEEDIFICVRPLYQIGQSSDSTYDGDSKEPEDETKERGRSTSCLFWSKRNEDPPITLSKGRMLPLTKIENLYEGKMKLPAFLHPDCEAASAKCFAVVSKRYELAYEADSREVAQFWVNGMFQLIRAAKPEAVRVVNFEDRKSSDLIHVD